MVINTHYKFVFVHVPKAAGTSVMKSLEQLRGNKRTWQANTKHETLAEFHRNVPRRTSVTDPFFFRDPTSYFAFGFVRNPWDRISSCYRYLVEKRPKEEIDTVSNFRDFLIQGRDGVGWIQELCSMKSQLDYFRLENGRLNVDFIGHYEFLTEDFRSVTKSLQCRDSLQHANRSSNNSLDYRELFDQEMIEIVGQRFSQEIALFDYTFDTPQPGRRFSGSVDRLRGAGDSQCRTMA